MGNPNFRAGADRTWELMRRRFGPSVSGNEHDAQETNIEAFRREKDEIETPAQGPIKANPSSGNTPTGNPPPPPALPAEDRWHKKCDLYITVSNPHNVTPDSVYDASAFHTITDAIAYAISIHAAVALFYGADVVIGIEVHGGLYVEDVIINVPYLRFYGISKPTIRGSVTFQSGCTKIIFDNFLIENFFDINASPLISIQIDQGVQSGKELSDVQVRNCIFRGNIVANIKRWCYFENCDFQLQGTTSLAVVNVQFVGVSADIPPLPAMTKWTVFRNCHFKAYNDGTDWRDRKNAIIIKAIDDHGVWYANNITYGAGSYAKTGVYLDHCEIDGLSANYGWNMEYYRCYGIQGHFINDGSGSWHHEPHCNSDQGVQSYTWFHHSRIAARYIAQTFDDSMAGTGGTCNIWISHTKHIAPDYLPYTIGAPHPQSGSAIHNTVAPINTNAIWVDFSDTHSKTWYDIGGGEIANLLVLTGGADSNSADPGGTQGNFYIQGYQDWP